MSEPILEPHFTAGSSSDDLASDDLASLSQTSGSAASRPRLSRAEWMLVIATSVWGMSFALAKGAGEAIDAAAGLHRHALGPITILAMRFTLSTIVWLVVIPAARHGWSLRGLWRGALVGALLATGLVLQHVALDYTIEAVAAFLTSLTVVFVPLILWLALGQRLAPVAWVGVAIALPGVWLMSDARGFSLGLGEWLGIACAVVFAWHLPLVNRFARSETPYRMAAAQFATVAIVCWISVPLCARGVDHFDWAVLLTRDVWLNVVLLVIGPTVVSFGLANVFQPRVDPVRAVLIYLLEPIFAALFAWLWTGRTMTGGMIAGGVLILVANGVVELWPMISRRKG